jgi:hypothetical protein
MGTCHSKNWIQRTEKSDIESKKPDIDALKSDIETNYSLKI